MKGVSLHTQHGFVVPLVLGLVVLAAAAFVIAAVALFVDRHGSRRR